MHYARVEGTVMSALSRKPIRTASYLAVLSLLALPSLALAQDSAETLPPSDMPQQTTTANAGWRRVGDPPQTAAQAPQSAEQPAEAPADTSNTGIPARLTIQPGTYVSVRIDDMLSSDQNHVGDAFTASLAKPIVVDGIVVAQRGQTVGGRVMAAEKAGRVEHVSRLAVQLTTLTLADGQQVPIQSQLTSWTGPTSKGRDATTIATTGALGAAIGAAAEGGTGAGIGAIAGGLAGTVGVLLTRGHPTVIYPETELTFRLVQPVTVLTEPAPLAFRYVEPSDYAQPPVVRQRAQAAPPGPCGVYGCAPYYGYGWGWPYYYSPYYWGPGFSFYYGPGFYWGRGFRIGGGFRGHGGGFHGGGGRGGHGGRR
jgi:uncharacterized membrane protein YgcG